MMRRKRLTLDQVKEALALYAQVRLRFVEVDLELAASLAYEHNIYAYDAYMMTCAIRLHKPLLSLDARLNTAARSAGITVWEVVL